MPQYSSKAITAPRIILGTEQQEPLNNTSLVRAYNLKVTGTWTVTGGTGAGTIPSDAVFRLIKKLTIYLHGKPLQTWTGQTLRVMHRFFSPEQYTQTPPSSLAAGTATPFALHLELPLYMPHSYSEDSFGLPTWTGGKPTLAVEWANANELVVGENATSITLANAAVKLYEVPLIGAPADPSQYGRLVVRQTEREVVQTATDFKVTLDNYVAGMETRAVIVECFAGGAAGADFSYSDTLLANVSWWVDAREWYGKTDWDVLQNRNKMRYRLPALEPGVVVIDAAENKRTGVGELFLHQTEAAPYIQGDVVKQTGECKIRITTLATDRLTGGRPQLARA